MSNTQNLEAKFNMATFGAADPSFVTIYGKRMLFGRQKVHIEGVNDNGHVYLASKPGGAPLLVEKDGVKVWPTLDLIREKNARGEVRIIDLPNDPLTISAFGDLFDPLATLEDNIKARATWHLASRAIANLTSRSKTGVNDFLDVHYGVGHYDLEIERPKWRTFIRAMNKVREGATVADLVNRSGAKKGSTPFPNETDRLIHQDILMYWAVPEFKRWEAYERHKSTIGIANTQLQNGAVPHKLVSRSAFYERIKEARCEETVAAKLGAAEAERQFGTSGEAITASYCFEYAYIDSTRLENVIVFDDQSRLPFIKPWLTSIMDMKSGAVLAAHVHCGDPRAETTIQTLLMSLAGPEQTKGGTDYTS